jgi:hypothetical protein
MTEQAISPSVTTQAITPSLTAQANIPSVSTTVVNPSVTTQVISPSVTAQAITPSVTAQAISPSVTAQAISPLRQRMIEDMAIRKFTAKTQHDYVQRVKEFATFLGRSPRTAEAEDVRRFQLHLTAKGAGTPKINATVSALRFLFTVTLNRADLARPLSSIHEPRKIPVVLSPEEVARFLEAAPGIKYKIIGKLFKLYTSAVLKSVLKALISSSIFEEVLMASFRDSV